MPELRVIISGGGTGGHIFPAIAIANAIKQIKADTEILFVGAAGRMEMEKVPAAGYKIEGLEIAGLQRSLTLKNLSFPFKLIKSLIHAGKIIDRFKPQVVVGVGGYASGPLLYMATRKRIPALVQEQNSYPGITNKLLAKRVQKICVAYDGMEKYFPSEKILMLGNPVRENMLSIEGKRNEAAKFFGLDENIKTILVIGGSLGARTINLSIQGMLNELVKNKVQVLWQTGKNFYSSANEVAKPFSSTIKVFDFIQQMDLAYAMSDVVISRAGASSVSELCIVRKPAILVPSPNVAEDHQTKNAMALVNKNAAILIKDAEAQQKLIPAALELMISNSRMEELRNNIGALALPSSAKNIAEQVIQLVK